jgi:hypothetical protein
LRPNAEFQWQGFANISETTNHSVEDIKTCHAAELQDIQDIHLIYEKMNKAGGTPI